MWLARQIAAGEGGAEIAVNGRVTHTRSQLIVQADGEYRDIPVYAPAGIAALPRVGESVLLLEANGGKHVIGVRCDTEGLEPGEIRLRSAGGAELLLKNNGQVLINGRVTAAAAAGPLEQEG